MLSRARQSLQFVVGAALDVDAPLIQHIVKTARAFATSILLHVNTQQLIGLALQRL
jgi:hypothetical protein